MASVTEDIFNVLVTFWSGKLTTLANVRLSNFDERDGEDGTTQPIYPLVSISLFDQQIDNNRRNGGFVRTVEEESEANWEITKLPVPITYHFQLDTFCQLREQDYGVNEVIMRVLGSQFQSVTLGSKVLYLVPSIQVPMDNLTDNIWRKTYRFYIEHWLPNADEPTIVPKILVRRFVINGENADFAS